MIALTLDTDVSAGEPFWGKTASDLQSNISVGATGITGTLKYIADYSTAFGSGEDSGNYIAVHASVPGVEGVEIKAEVVGGTHGEVTLDDDGILIARIASTSQKLKFTADMVGFAPVSKTYDLTGLTLNNE